MKIQKAIDYIEIKGAFVDPYGFKYLPDKDIWINEFGDTLTSEEIHYNWEKFTEIGKGKTQ